MGGSRLRRIGEIFNGALELPEAERESWLARACGDDVGLLREVRELLAGHGEAFDFFDQLGEEIARGSAAELAAASGRDFQIGPYRVVRELGRGGMGVVYLAERSDGQFDRQVALKLIPRGMESESAVRRFLAERQILARLDHPNIARLFDGGVSDDGRPFLVMEVVDGVPLDTHCDRQELGVDGRLRLFTTICDAVQYAHRNLVVHRDLKPSNILVTADGSIKLVDFGIAKLLEEEEREALTRTGQRALTPDYAAPEQVLGQPVTTATDVYTLGVILFELLTGQRPYRLKGRTAGEVERLISDTQPPLPSTVVGRLDSGDEGPSAEEIARSRSTRPDRLRRRLAGDLDRIVLKALRKEPDRRYPSAEQLTADIERHLEGLPVLARGDSLLYRSGKFVRRHAFGVAAAALFALLVIGFGLVMALQSVRLARERDRAEQVSALLVELFELADPSEARGETVTAREILDRGTSRISSRLSDQPRVKADLLDLMGQVYRNLGLYEKARPLLGEALELREEGRADPADVAESLDHLGELLRLQGDYAAAEPLLRRSLALRERGEGRSTPGYAQTLNTLGKVLLGRGRYEEAEREFRRALEINRTSAGVSEAEVGENVNNLGALLYAEGRLEEAERLFREALELRRRALGTDHPLVAGTLNNLAALLSRSGRHRAAQELQEETLDLYRRLLGESHPRVATLLNNLGLTLMAQGDLGAAEPLFRRSLQMRRALLDEHHPDIAQSLGNLGVLLRDRGRLDEAESLHREALSIQRAALGDRHPTVVANLNNLAMTLRAKGDLDEAERLLRDGLATLRDFLGDQHPQVATSLSNLADLLRERGGLDEAEGLYRDSLAIRRSTLPAGHPHLAYSLVGLGRLLQQKGESVEAEALLREGLEIRVETLPPDHWQIAEARAALGLALLDLGRREEGLGLLESGRSALSEARLADLRRRAEEALGDTESLAASTDGD